MANTLKFGNGEWYGKKDTILAYNDENNNYKPLLFDFSRNSSATVVNKDGLIETVGSGQPRIDYKNNTKGALLLEPQSTNLIPYSEDFSNSYWAKSSVTLTSGFLAPDGSNNAYKVEGTIGTSYLGNLTANTHLRSIYVRTVSGTGKVKLLGNTTLYDVTEEWTRVSFNPTSNTYQFAVDFRGGTDISEVLIWGVQVEQQSYATSYIPTQGSAVTRLFDDMPNHLNINPLNIGNSYTLFLDTDLNKVVNNMVFCEIENSASNDVFTIRNTIGQIRVYNNLDAQYPTVNLQSNTNRWAIRIDGNSYKIFGADNSLSGTLPTARNIGKIKFYGSSTKLKINNFNIYNTALSDAECEALVN